MPNLSTTLVNFKSSYLTNCNAELVDYVGKKETPLTLALD